MVRIGLFTEDRKLYPLLASALGREFEILLTLDEPDLIRSYQDDLFDVALLDLDSNARRVIDHVNAARRIIDSGTPSVLMADDGQRTVAAELMHMGAHAICRKPPAIRELKAALLRAFDHTNLKRQVDEAELEAEINSRCDRMIGGSPVMHEVYDLVRRVADLNASVLITGESGTGKELIAGAIHNLGTRAGKPFIAVSCGAIPESLIESELFGHEKGAFTGSTGTRAGYLEQAEDGTIFLDEIGELSPNVQVKLLRVLQQREFCRLGSSKVIPLRARLVFATHRELADMVAVGRFRQDLYYRINVMRIEAPALQQRSEDIPMLANHFLTVYGEQFGKPMQGIEPRAMALLRQYAWPGNVRELENVVQRAIIVAKDDLVRAEDLPRMMQEQSVVNIEDYPGAGTFDLMLRDYKVKLAEASVREHNGNKTLAAKSLSISRAYLHRLLRLGEGEGEGEDVDAMDEPESGNTIAIA